jgi:hypothetical protein
MANIRSTSGIRLELMEFHSTDKPCSSPFIDDDPKPELRCGKSFSVALNN